MSAVAVPHSGPSQVEVLFAYEQFLIQCGETAEAVVALVQTRAREVMGSEAGAKRLLFLFGVAREVWLAEHARQASLN